MSRPKGLVRLLEHPCANSRSACSAASASDHSKAHISKNGQSDTAAALGHAGSACPGLKGLFVFSNIPAQIVDLPAQPRRPATIQRLIYQKMAKVTRQQPLAKQEVHVQA